MPVPLQDAILLHKGGHVFADLEIYAVSEGDRDDSGTLKSEGGVTFISPKGKHWFIKFSEFSFLINSRRKAENQ